MKNMKRIHKVVVKREVDTDPDTSYLGEYSNRPESEYAIDREHATDCVSQTYNEPVYAKGILSHAIAHLDVQDGCADTPANDAEDILNRCLNEVEECNCGGRDDMCRNEYQYFNPWHENYAGCARAEIVKYCLQDYERMQDYNNQGWCYLLIGADAEVVIDGHIQRITSGYVGGIESDSGEDYLRETEQEQLAELRGQLHAIGFSKRAIAAAFKDVEREAA